MATKTAVQSNINMVAVLTLVSDTLVFMLEEQGFIDAMGAWLLVIQGLSTALIVYLRIYKTTKPIKGIIKKPMTKPAKKLDPIEQAIRDQDDMDIY